jgi:hypothetical protein
MNAIAALQVTHLVLLFAIPVSFALLRFSSEGDDRTVQQINAVVSLVAAAWASSIVVAAVFYGSKEDGLKALWRSYRILLTHYFFLSISVGVFLIVELFLLWHFILYRPITFFSPEEVVLLLNDDVAHVIKIGTVKGGGNTTIRLKVGTRHLAFRTTQDGYIGVLQPINVPGWWSSQPAPVIRIPKSKPYEKLH